MLSEPTSDLARTGLIVAGKFRLDALIGRGGMGSVWSATHLGLGHQIAIKLVSREFVRSPAALRRFDAEAKAVARLQSRHVVQVYDNGTLDDGTPYIAMELLFGESLQQRIDRAGPLSTRETVSILSQCCKALGRAHSIGIVHRDIKPDNIFLARCADEDDEVAKILDFGVAKVAMGTGTDGDQSTTKTGVVLGTPLYMSPEQARGLKTIDHRTDLYSLGLVTYTMLTGRDAFEGESFGDILIKICVEPLPRLSASANVSPGMGRWFERVCARDPAERCASAQEFIDSLRQASGVNAAAGSGFDAFPVAATLTDIPAPPQQFAISEPSVADANVSVTAAGVPRRPRGVVVILAVLGALVLIGAVAFFVLPAYHAGPRSTEIAGAAAPAATVNMPAPSAALAPRPIEPVMIAPIPIAVATSTPSATAIAPSPERRPSPQVASSAHVGPQHAPASTPNGTLTIKPAPLSPKIDLGY